MCERNDPVPKGRKKQFICISVFNLDLTGSSTLKRNTMEEIIFAKVTGNFSP